MLESPIFGRTDETESLFNEANTIEDSQQSLLETASIEQQFDAALQSLIQQKFDQVDRIEDKISAILMRQQGRLQKLTNAKPSILSLPKTKRIWQQELQKQNIVIGRIEKRLSFVKDMRESMGLHEPRIEELASRKLQHNDPKLYSEHDKFKAHLRAIENEKSKKDREKHLTKKAKKSLTLAKTSPL